VSVVAFSCFKVLVCAHATRGSFVVVVGIKINNIQISKQMCDLVSGSKVIFAERLNRDPDNKKVHILEFIAAWFSAASFSIFSRSSHGVRYIVLVSAVG